MSRALPFASLVFASALAGCGGQAFDPQFAERQQPQMAGVLEDIAAAPPRTSAPVIAAVVRTPPAILLWDLAENRERWRVETDARSTPIVAGEYVVTTEADGVVVRRLADGVRTFAVSDPELHLVGADGEGNACVLAFARGDGDSPLGYLVGVRDGAGAWSHELPLPVGVPALVGSVVVVPWGHQRLSMLAAADGTERLRARLQHGVVGHALHLGHEVYVGQHTLYALSDELVGDEEREPVGFGPRGRSLPGQPPFLADAYERRMETDSARNRVRLAWAMDDGAAEGAAPSFADGALYFTFYRLVFGLTAGEDDVRWVQDRGRDVVGADGIAGGVIVVTDDGNVTLLAAADGHATPIASLGTEVRAAHVRAAGVAIPAEAPAPTPEPLGTQLGRIAALHDVRVGSGRALAIRFLARDDSAEVTRQLIALCADRTDTSQARTAACDQLAERTNGGQHVLAALHEGASFLDQRPAPPIGALARAAASMHLVAAVPFLVGHLEDPATPVEELGGLFDGLGRLGDARAEAPIEAFVRLYHADATDAPTIDAVAAGARALLLLDEDRSDDLTALAADPLAPAPVRERLTASLVAQQAPPPVAAPVAPPRPQAHREVAPPSDLPVALTSEMVAAALAPVASRLHQCLEPTGDAEPFPSARIMIMVDDAGEIATVSVTPASLQGCIEPIVTPRSLPRTRRGSEVMVHTVRR